MPKPEIQIVGACPRCKSQVDVADLQAHFEWHDRLAKMLAGIPTLADEMGI